MGSELAPWEEWNHDRPLPWERAEDPLRAGFGRFLADLGGLYRASPALWATDPEPSTFAWIDAADVESSVYSWIRRAGDDLCVVVQNLTPVPRHGYRLGLPRAGSWAEVLNTDSAHYGGSDTGNLGGVEAEEQAWHGQAASATLTLPPLATLFLRPRGAVSD
jgi:1,4-alpha-glucan branching enzyme